MLGHGEVPTFFWGGECRQGGSSNQAIRLIPMGDWCDSCNQVSEKQGAMMAVEQEAGMTDLNNCNALAIGRALLVDTGRLMGDPIYFLIFDEATSNLDSQTAEHFARTINKLKGQVSMLFITHQLPKGLNVDEAVLLGRDKETEELQNEKLRQE